jgi:predicted Zn-dependent protease
MVNRRFVWMPLFTLGIVVLSAGMLWGSLPALSTEALASAASTPPASQTTEATAEQILQKLCTANGINRKQLGSMTLKQSDTINAYTDGKNIVMYSKLWDLLKTEDRRAFVLGHELGHIRAGHVIKGGVLSTSLSVLSRVVSQASGNALVGIGSQLGAQLIGLKYTRVQEYQADDLGFQFFQKAGYRPEASVEAFKIMSQASQGGSQKVEFLRSHPLDQNRIDQLIQKHSIR